MNLNVVPRVNRGIVGGEYRGMDQQPTVGFGRAFCVGNGTGSRWEGITHWSIAAVYYCWVGNSYKILLQNIARDFVERISGK